MQKESFSLKGALTAELFKADGTYHVIHKHNAILSCGFDFICDAVCSATRPDSMAYIAVGTGDDEVALSQTALVAPLEVQAATYEHTAGTKVFKIITTFAEGVATGSITEACVQNAESEGVLLDRVVFPVINKGEDDTLKMTFTFTLS
jgi:hypothetical protein